MRADSLQCARGLDAARSYSLNCLRFYWGEEKSILDITGETAMSAIARCIDRNDDARAELREIFARLQA